MSKSCRQRVAMLCAGLTLVGLTVARRSVAEDQLEVTGNVYCRTADDAVERPLGAVRVYLKQRPDLVAESGAGNGKFRLLLPAAEVVDRDVTIVYRDARFQLGEETRRVAHDDVTVVAGRMALQLAPRIFVVTNCTDLDAAGLRETVRLAVERMSHRAALVQGELVRAHTAANPDSAACLNDTLSRIGAHLRFAESRVPRFMDAIGDDSVRARREVTAIKIADERVSELVEEADHCLERSVAHASTQTTKYDPDQLISPSELAQFTEENAHPEPWGRRRVGAAAQPTDDDWHADFGAALETGYDSNFVQKKERSGGSVPAAWQFRPSLHLALYRFDLKSATASPATMQTGPAQSGNLSLVGVLLTSTQAGGRPLGLYSDVAVAADFKARFGDDAPLGGLIAARYNRLVEPTIEPEHTFAYGTNAIGLTAEALARPGSGRFEMGLGYRLGLDYHDSIYQQAYNRVRHAAVIRERWLFLPETALVHETELSTLGYVGNQLALNDSVQLRFRMGLIGVFAERISVEALLGRAEGYYTKDHGSTPNFAGLVGHAKVEWFLGPIAPRSYPNQALVRPSFALAYDHDYRDNITSDYYKFDRGQAGLSLNVEDRWLLGLNAGLSRIGYPQSRYFNPATYSLDYYKRFSETRVELAGSVEYRILPQLRFTLSYRYDRNLSDKSLPIEPALPGVSEPLAFRRTRLYAGVIWTL